MYGRKYKRVRWKNLWVGRDGRVHDPVNGGYITIPELARRIQIDGELVIKEYLFSRVTPPPKDENWANIIAVFGDQPIPLYNHAAHTSDLYIGSHRGVDYYRRGAVHGRRDGKILYHHGIYFVARYSSVPGDTQAVSWNMLRRVRFREVGNRTYITPGRVQRAFRVLFHLLQNTAHVVSERSEWPVITGAPG